MATVLVSPAAHAVLPPFDIYEDEDRILGENPETTHHGKLYDQEAAFLDTNGIIPSIEHEAAMDSSEPEPYSSAYTTRSPTLERSQLRRASGLTTTSLISSLPSELSIASKPVTPAYNPDGFPKSNRPMFRNPASVRAMQMASPPPLPAFESPRDRLKGSYKFATPSRPVSANGSVRSASRRESMHKMSQDLAQSPKATAGPQQHLPLVLLHVTILPMQLPYQPEVMAKVMPAWLHSNFKLLEEKLQDVVLMRRGLLIPHPNDEYDLLEERILETLELKPPRLLKCGHFLSPADESDEVEDDTSVTGDETGRGSRMSGGTVTAEDDVDYTSAAPGNSPGCSECDRYAHRPGSGVGAGNKRWDIKVYAANGLMRAGAWAAAWKEMERCDVEISPWVPLEVKESIEEKVKEDQERDRQRKLYEAEIQRLVEEERARQRLQEAETERRAEEQILQEKAAAQAVEDAHKMEQIGETLKQALVETLEEKVANVQELIRKEFAAQAGAKVQAALEHSQILDTRVGVDTLPSHTATSHGQLPTDGREAQTRSRSRNSRRDTETVTGVEEIPLGTLLKNYIFLLAQDRRDLVLVVLAALVIFLTTTIHTPLQPAMNLHEPLIVEDPDYLSGPGINSGMISTTTLTTRHIHVSTATVTATSISTTTVTQVEQLRIEEIASPAEQFEPLVETKTISLVHQISGTMQAQQNSAGPISGVEIDTTTTDEESSDSEVHEAVTDDPVAAHAEAQDSHQEPAPKDSPPKNEEPNLLAEEPLVKQDDPTKAGNHMPAHPFQSPVSLDILTHSPRFSGSAMNDYNPPPFTKSADAPESTQTPAHDTTARQDQLVCQPQPKPHPFLKLQNMCLTTDPIA
ncbi:hypothetical protein M011DRAFT_484917 [Sporormia fimetaria CBS 119925]|uniref:Pathway-specific nitrogen regulator n=1 Tax=Sporormia fimetaria CBS 119925 TaxID=1340428 RepID=A0A6A6VJX9_9PLEO|nr:hypothetical protein M011DRAFT_484917 [Sporormia fimetaria CBS 119925]